ncbi:MAG: hypothetical protein M3O46_23200, partial [Myxococcota bacterium]|nr:hypothetical protein [Myxococcota bacterium]
RGPFLWIGAIALILAITAGAALVWGGRRNEMSSPATASPSIGGGATMQARVQADPARPAAAAAVMAPANDLGPGATSDDAPAQFASAHVTPAPAPVVATPPTTSQAVPARLSLPTKAPVRDDDIPALR